MRTWLKFGSLLVAVTGAVCVARALGWRWSDCTPERVRLYVLSFGLWAPIIYMLVYGQPLIPMPASVMWMAGGLSFGILPGAAMGVLASTVRGCGQFLIARHWGREAVERFFRGRLARWDEAVAERGFQTVLWVRIVPNVPFDLQNLSLGCSGVSLKAFAPATAIGLIPWVLTWAYLGHTVTDPRQLWTVLAALFGCVGLWWLYTRLQRVKHPA